MSPQRRIALVSVAAACLLIAIKLAAGLASDSLGLLSEALHSGTDLVAALLTFFALGVAVRPADSGHPYGHGKAEHLSALAEAAILVLASLVIVWRAVDRLLGEEHPEVNAAWWTFAVLGVVIAIDLARALVSVRGARRYRSAALAANALHFAGDFGGTAAVLIGLLLVRAGYQQADSAAALRIPRVREIHNVAVRRIGDRTEVSLHLKLPGDLSLGEAHGIASRVERAIAEAVPEVDAVQTHLEPLAEPARGSAPAPGEVEREAARVRQIVREVVGVDPRELRFLETDEGLIALLTVAVEPGTSLAEAHARASEVEEAIRRARPEIADVLVHTEP